MKLFQAWAVCLSSLSPQRALLVAKSEGSCPEATGGVSAWLGR